VALGSAAGFNATTGANNMYIGYGVAGIAVKATSVTSPTVDLTTDLGVSVGFHGKLSTTV